MFETPKPQPEKNPQKKQPKVFERMGNLFRGLTGRPIEHSTPDGALIARMTVKDPNKSRSEDLSAVGEQFYVVLDGMGKLGHGREAAQIAKKVLVQELSTISPTDSAEVIEKAMRAAMNAAHRAIVDYRKQKDIAQMGTTASVVFIKDNEDGSQEAIIGNGGDSRVYMEVDGVLKLLTLDNSAVQTGLKMSASPQFTDRQRREIQLALDKIDHKALEKLSKAEREKALNILLNNIAKAHNISFDFLEEKYALRHSLSMYLGQRDVASKLEPQNNNLFEPNIIRIQIPKGARIFIFSDGTTDNIPFTELQTIVATTPDSSEVISKIIERAQEGPKQDDVTAMVVKTRSAGNGGNVHYDDEQFLVNIYNTEILEMILDQDERFRSARNIKDIYDFLNSIEFLYLHGSHKNLSSVEKRGISVRSKLLRTQVESFVETGEAGLLLRMFPTLHEKLNTIKKKRW